MISYARLEELLDQFPKLTIGLVGDLFLDRYLEIAPGVFERSLETDLEAYQIPVLRNAPGALGTVMNNLAALGVGQLVPITVLGDDGHGYDLRKELERLPVVTDHLLTDRNRLTPTYTKPLKQNAQGEWEELHRLDVRTRGPLSSETCRRVCDSLRDAVQTADGLVVLDQVDGEEWGVVHSNVRRFLEQLTRDMPEKLVYIDSRAHLSQFGFGVLKGNRQELLAAAGIARDEDALVGEAVRLLSQRTGRAVFCTLGEDGILVARPGCQPERVAGCPVHGPVDIVGAGDSATSGI
ncbi:MAG: bifunctional heptose 7-phosphate kinase/heptose 1-phosphate adenyltransferase, partial [Pirellulaceae bacterium]